MPAREKFAVFTTVTAMIAVATGTVILAAASPEQPGQGCLHNVIAIPVATRPCAGALPTLAVLRGCTRHYNAGRSQACL